MVERIDKAITDPGLRPSCAAFDREWRLHRDSVWRLAVRLSGSVDAADDLTQEVAVRAFRSFRCFRSDARFSTWVFRITVNTVTRWREGRRNGRRSLDSPTVAPLASSEPTPESRVVLNSLRDVVWKALDGLPDDQRTALILRVYEGLSYKEIAAVMECPNGTVMSRLHAARSRMREELKNYEL